MKQEGKKLNQRKPVVILADDDPDVIEQVSLIVTQEGCEAHTAGTAAATEDLLLSVKPDLAILDVMMDERDSGFILCRQIKKLHPGTPVIILTAVKAETGMSFSATTDDKKSWLQADCMLDKPVRPDKLRAEVRRLLGMPAHHKAAH